MDLKGSLVDTNVRIYPSDKLLDFLKTIIIERTTPDNVLKFVKGKDYVQENKTKSEVNPIDFTLNKKDIEHLEKVKHILKSNESANNFDLNSDCIKSDIPAKDTQDSKITPESENEISSSDSDEKADANSKEHSKEYEEVDELYLTTADIEWLHIYLKRKRVVDKSTPFLHELLAGVQVEMPHNKILKRNPVLEERCVKLRAQQEARDYRKMTKGVDNVRMRFPEDSISYQMKQLNRQLIAIGQFILSIFAGFLFGFRGIEWMVGNLDFGFRLLLGVMCALIIALAEIYFLAKKLNDELNVPETVQLGGPVKFAEERTCHGRKIYPIDKEHQD